MHVVFEIFQIFLTILIFDFSCGWLLFQKLLLLDIFWRLRYFLLRISTDLNKIILYWIASLSSVFHSGLIKLFIIVPTSLCLAALSIVIAPIIFHVAKWWSLLPARALVIAPAGWEPMLADPAHVVVLHVLTRPVRVQLGCIGHHALGELTLPLLDHVQGEAFPDVFDVVVDSVHKLLRLVYVVRLNLVINTLVWRLYIWVLDQLRRWVATAFGFGFLVGVEEALVLAVCGEEGFVYLLCVQNFLLDIRWSN